MKLSRFPSVTGVDWKGLGYLISIVSVLLLGAQRVAEAENPLPGICRR